ncbi:hypothetical protein BGZ65_002015 [Modicella reniformis]|uniref:G domain-containing protein n=1 Tax=Modicella reniformis TaxID=1440133 RepID=A0A9P6J1R9_9FUNG|nr:hypothetical protein BGZ65_002015 [Modicella reniformis]
MDVPNVGQDMALGDLYDARTGHCTNISVLKNTLPETLIESQDENAINTALIYEETYKKKFDALDIKGNLKLNILANLISVNAQGKYLTTEKKSSKSVKVSMSYAVQTKLERINIRSDMIREYINTMALDDPGATHVVTGIQWGANMVCSLEHTLNGVETKEEVSGILSAACNTVSVGLELGGEIDKGSNQSIKDISFQISILGDIIPKADSYPTTVEGVVQFMRQVPEFVKGINKGKRSVLQYKLESIDKIRDHFDLDARVVSIINTISSGQIDQVESIFDTIVENRIRLNEALKDILEYKQYITASDVKRINMELKSFDRGERDFKHSLSETVQAIQTGNHVTESEDALAEMLEEFEMGRCYTPVVDNVIESYQDLSRRISFIRQCIKVGINVIPREQEISDFLSHSSTVKTFILFIPNSIDYTTVLLSHDWRVFQLLKADNENANFVIHDASISPADPQSKDLTNLTILKYHGSKKSDQDTFRASILRPSIKLFKTELMTQEERTTGQTLRMPCPSSHEEGECSPGALKWVCFKCEEVLLYEYNEVVYCGCGETPLKNCTFRCDSDTHGYQYKELHDRSINSIREKIRPGDDEINILLLGETGVGKSTFINAFANYLRYDSLEVAERMEMTTLIQSSFEIDGVKVIAGGEDTNEKLEDGQSSTQLCRSYVFPLNDDIKIRLIDTPGVGDTRGVKQDRKNFEEIMDYISGFNKINGVCILLLPDTPRLTTSFQFCIDELLLHLHKSAAGNILFTFTKTRSSFYGPGDTMRPLGAYVRELEKSSGITIPLEPNTMFFFDNESFRLYAAIKQGITFGQSTKDAFGASWTKSVQEARRLVKRVMELTPHNTTETVTLDMVRRSILLLAPPMAKINENITVEVQAIKDLTTKAKNNNELKKNLMSNIMDMDPINLSRPRTVCTSPSCTTLHGNITKYDKHCHDNCYLSNVTINVVHHVGLIHCAAIKSDGTCGLCGCPWEKHMHVKIDYTQVTKQVVDTKVEKELEKNRSEAEKLDLQINKANERKTTLESEKKVVFASLMTFTGFLLQNSILVQNNGVLAYIDMSIDNQERRAQITQDFTVVNSLRAQRKEFMAQMEVIEAAVKDGKSNAAKIKADDVAAAREALCRLKINGKAIVNILQWGKQNQSEASNRETRIVGGYVSGGWSFSSTVHNAAKKLVPRKWR